MSKILAALSQKGGTGKSTVSRNLANLLVKEGYKVLVVDCDNQSSLTDCFGIQNPENLEVTLYHLMMKVINDEDLPKKEAYIIQREGVDIIPSSIELSAVEISLVNTMSREYVLKTILDKLKPDYDFLICDGMPSLGLMTLNVMAACDGIIIPATPEYLSAKGIELVLKSIMKVKRRINPELQVEGILLNMFEEHINLSKDILQMLDESYGKHLRIFETRIPKSVKVGEANYRSMSITDYMSNHKVSMAYHQLVKELIAVGRE